MKELFFTQLDKLLQASSFMTEMKNCFRKTDVKAAVFVQRRHALSNRFKEDVSNEKQNLVSLKNGKQKVKVGQSRKRAKNRVQLVECTTSVRKRQITKKVKKNHFFLEVFGGVSECNHPSLCNCASPLYSPSIRLFLATITGVLIFVFPKLLSIFC